jgi:hypothetical protein
MATTLQEKTDAGQASQKKVREVLIVMVNQRLQRRRALSEERREVNNITA